MLRPGGTIAVWGYALNTFDGEPAATQALRMLHGDVLGPYWDPKRRLLDAEYKGVGPCASHQHARPSWHGLTSALSSHSHLTARSHGSVRATACTATNAYPVTQGTAASACVQRHRRPAMPAVAVCELALCLEVSEQIE